MGINYIFISAFLISYLSIYLIFHLPLDIMMLIKRGGAKYPSPPFKNFIQGITFVLPSLFFWFYVAIIPFFCLFYGIDLFSLGLLEVIPSVFSSTFQVIGISILSIGLIIDCLGRIGRGTYLKNQKPVLSTTWGHAVVRHPSYFHYITGFIGLPLITFNPFLLFLLIGIYGYLCVIDIEEEALIQHFGEEYIKYMNIVGKLFTKLRKI
jgi:protein-S-isoprenylcysteine O-methyltransferase Ste14